MGRGGLRDLKEMSKRKKTPTLRPAKGDRSDRRCAFAESHGCTNSVTDEDWCFGCGFYICESCSVGDAMGDHDVVEHREEID